QQIDDRLRRSRRHEHASYGFRLLPSNADVFESWHIGQRRRTLLGGDCKRPELALLDQVDVIAEGGADDRRVPADQRLRHGAAALEWYGDEIEAKGELEHFDRQRRRRAGTGRSDAVLAGLALD